MRSCSATMRRRSSSAWRIWSEPLRVGQGRGLQHGSQSGKVDAENIGGPTEHHGPEISAYRNLGGESGERRLVLWDRCLRRRRTSFKGNGHCALTVNVASRNRHELFLRRHPVPGLLRVEALCLLRAATDAGRSFGESQRLRRFWQPAMQLKVLICVYLCASVVPFPCCRLDQRWCGPARNGSLEPQMHTDAHRWSWRARNNQGQFGGRQMGQSRGRNLVRGGSEMNNGRAESRVIVLHGAHGGPDTNWFPWLHAALNAEGIEVLRPQFPTPEGQSLKAWVNAYDLAVKPLPLAPTILVGHSLGAALALRLVERAVEPFDGLFLAAPFVGALGLPDYDSINQSFFAVSYQPPGPLTRT